MNLGKKVRSNCTLEYLLRFYPYKYTVHGANARSNKSLRVEFGRQRPDNDQKIKLPQSSDFRQELLSKEKQKSCTDRPGSMVNLSKSRNISNHALIESINIEEVLGNFYRRTFHSNNSFINKLRLKTNRKKTSEPDSQPFRPVQNQITLKNKENNAKKIRIKLKKISLKSLFRQKVK